VSDDEVDTGDEECHSCGSYGHSTNQCGDGIEELREQHRGMLELLRRFETGYLAGDDRLQYLDDIRALLKQIDG
jgi:hypothetical protein